MKENQISLKSAHWDYLKNLFTEDLNFSCYTSTLLTASPLRSARRLYPLKTNQEPDDCTTLQQVINKLHHWSHTWQMAFNASKCYTMAISRKLERPSVEFYLYPTVGTVLIHSVKPELTE